MLLIEYSGTEHCFNLMRNNPSTGFAERKQVLENEVKFLIPDDGAINAVLQLAKQVPNQYHVVPNRQPNPRQAWGRMVL